jgi:hypothetical protein
LKLLGDQFLARVIGRRAALHLPAWNDAIRRKLDDSVYEKLPTVATAPEALEWLVIVLIAISSCSPPAAPRHRRASPWRGVT